MVVDFGFNMVVFPPIQEDVDRALGSKDTTLFRNNLGALGEHL